MHPKLEPLIQNEVKKLLDAKIIFRARHSEWVANLVPVRKKSGEIRLCVDFLNMKRASDKYNYPVPPMEQILKMVSGSELFSLLNGFSGYNQVLVVEQDMLKTTFGTKWGTLQKNALQTHQCWSHFSKGNGYCFPGVNRPQCGSLSR